MGGRLAIQQEMQDRARQKSFQVEATIILRRTELILIRNMWEKRSPFVRELHLEAGETIPTRLRPL